MDNNISEEKLRAAKEKLACHIEPPGSHAAHATQQEQGSSCGIAAIPQGGKVRLTEMTSAGG